MDDPIKKDNPKWMEEMDLAFLYIYTIEMSIKIIALGYINLY